MAFSGRESQEANLEGWPVAPPWAAEVEGKRPGLGQVSVLRRTNSSLMREEDIDPKVVADQLCYTKFAGAPLKAVETLEASLVNLMRMGYIGIHPISEGWMLLILRAGDGDRTRDVQLGKLGVD
jgi:hypothetical protein